MNRETFFSMGRFARRVGLGKKMADDQSAWARLFALERGAPRIEAIAEWYAGWTEEDLQTIYYVYWKKRGADTVFRGSAAFSLEVIQPIVDKLNKDYADDGLLHWAADINGKEPQS